MVYRFSVWVGAVAVAVGIPAAMLAGAGGAAATDGASSDGGGTSTTSTSSTSESSNSPAAKQDSSIGGQGAGISGAKGATPEGGADANGPDAKPDDKPDEKDNPDEKGDPAEQDEKGGTTGGAVTTSPSEEPTGDEVIDENPADGEIDNRNTANGDTAGGSNNDTAVNTAPVKPAVTFNQPAVEGKRSIERNAVEAVLEQQPSTSRTVVELSTPLVEGTEQGPETAAVAFASTTEVQADATATASPLAGLLDAIGTIVFTIYGLATQILGGPPVLPPGSTVTVRTSTLRLDCGCNPGDGVEVQADWYVPQTAEGEAPPDRLIYLQHGFLARGPWYSYTAAALAEQTGSIVVAPSITSNFLASNACWLGGSAMHESMARLFDDGNTALADSAAAAGYTDAIPDRVVLIGHSLGGGAVIGIAGAMAGKPSEQKLAGVIMLDGVPFDPQAAEMIAAVDDSIPIYNLAAPRYFWNQFGVGTDALLEARPGKFIGVTLVDGSHVDPMRGGNPLIQFGQELVAGFVRPENGDAAQILMNDWANEMFDGIYRDPITDPFTIDTPSGVATAVPLPNSLTKPFILNFLQSLASLGTGFFTIEPSCVQESVASNTCTFETVAA